MEIDFVVLWVDGSDPLWRAEFERYALKYSGDKSPKRFRDWDNMHYLFRAFEQFTPWVRTIHFVTWGHFPKWLNLNHPKINIVRHDEFLERKNLPIFNSRAIEINLHRIKGLSEKFVFFNDDTFILKKLSPERFFRNDLPCDMMAFTSILMTHLAHVRLNDLLIVNKYFDKRVILRRHFFKWFNLKYKEHLLKSILLLPWPQITGFVDPHQPQPFLKSTFLQLWDKEQEVLEQTSKSKFKNTPDVNQYLFRYWQLLNGNFTPVSFSDSTCIQIESIEDARNTAIQIENNKKALFCVNDLLDDNDESLFQMAISIVNDAFGKVLPEKSDFEI